MSGSAVVAIVIFGLAMVATVVVGVASGRGREKSMSEWSVSNRGLGAIFIIVLMAGETYTSFSFLGAAGWSYSYGVPILYLSAYLCVGFLVAYIAAPLFWTYGSRHGLMSISDLVEHRFSSRPLAIATAVLATVFLVPYIQLQIQGMGVVVNAMSYGSINLSVAAVISFVVAEAFVLVSGLRGSAWVSVFKDGLVILSVVFLAVFVPLHYFDGVGPFIQKMITEKSDWLTFPGHGAGTFGSAWFISTIVLNAVTIVIFPTSISGYLGSKSPNALRRNSIVLPWYQLLLFVPMMIGCAALFVVPALKDTDLALFAVVTDSLPAPIVAIIGVAGALSAIVPMSVYMLSIGTMWGKTVLGGGIHGVKGQGKGLLQKRMSQLVCLIVGVLALLGSLLLPSALVSLSVLSYEGLGQLVPVVFLALLWPRMTKKAGIAGLTVGVVVMLGLFLTGNDPLAGINGGLIALVLNTIVVVVVSLASPDRRTTAVRAEPEEPAVAAAGD